MKDHFPRSKGYFVHKENKCMKSSNNVRVEEIYGTNSEKFFVL